MILKDNKTITKDIGSWLYMKAAYEEAERTAKFAELLGEVVTGSTKKNLQMRVEAENGATAGKVDLAKRAKAANARTLSTTQCMKWLAMKLDTEKHSQVCLRDAGTAARCPPPSGPMR